MIKSSFVVATLMLLLTFASQAAPLPPPGPSASPATTMPKSRPSDMFTFGDVMALVAAAKQSRDVVGIIKASTNVEFVEVHLLRGYTPAADVFTPVEQRDLVTLDATVGRNNSLMKKLRRAGFLLSDVVAVTVDADGNAIAFINL